jgi:hypothetical protein
MKISVKAELVDSFAEATQVIASIEVAHSDDQSAVSEVLDIEPAVNLLRDEMSWGDRKIRASFSGQITIRYQAIVDNRVRQLLPTAGRQHIWSELPVDVLPFLLPSRLCPSDKFMRFAQREFAASGDGVARVMSMLDWINRNVDYISGVSDAETTAERTFVDRAGVCRDFAHLGALPCPALWAFRPEPSAPTRLRSIPPTSTPSLRFIWTTGGGWSIRPGWRPSKALSASATDEMPLTSRS